VISGVPGTICPFPRGHRNTLSPKRHGRPPRNASLYVEEGCGGRKVRQALAGNRCRGHFCWVLSFRRGVIPRTSGPRPPHIWTHSGAMKRAMNQAMVCTAALRQLRTFGSCLEADAHELPSLERRYVRAAPLGANSGHWQSFLYRFHALSPGSPLPMGRGHRPSALDRRASRGCLGNEYFGVHAGAGIRQPALRGRRLRHRRIRCGLSRRVEMGPSLQVRQSHCGPWLARWPRA
jgi:hypothetical protein